MSNYSYKKNNHGYFEIFPKPTVKELEAYYERFYYQEAKGSYELSYTDDEKKWITSKNRIRRLFIESFLGIDDNNERSLLDVGCGEGFLLSEFHLAGWKVTGIDFSRHGLKVHNPSMLNYFMQGDIMKLLTQASLGPITYSCIGLQNVLEHVIDPEALLVSVRRLMSLEPRACLMVVVPNDFSNIQEKLMSSGHIETEFWVKPPEHLSYFTRESLVALAASVGLSELAAIGDFPVDLFLFNQYSNYITNSKLGKEAHRARVEIETFINEQNWEKAFSFYEASLEVGLGRNIVAFFTLSS